MAHSIVLTQLEEDELKELVREAVHEEVQNAVRSILHELQSIQLHQPDRLLSRDETAAMLGISPPTLTRWSNEHVIDSVDLGTASSSKVLYRLSDVQRIIATAKSHSS